ncbi:MAG: helix-turn-helix transcriptional regulator [Chitinophagales bacterium]|nr:helix-turn-helix transcriptional regulator [Chitinophagales bacterium]
MIKNDWILKNINQLIDEKGIKLEYISAKLGISQGEVSKILKGERECYTKYVYQFSQILNEPYHDLVKNDEVNQYNYGEIKDNGIGNVRTLKKSIDIEVFEQRIQDKDDLINLEREQKIQEREQKEYWKEKYYRIKEKLALVEEKLKSK